MEFGVIKICVPRPWLLKIAPEQTSLIPLNNNNIDIKCKSYFKKYVEAEYGVIFVLELE